MNTTCLVRAAVASTVLAGLASAATVRKADDTVVQGEVAGIREGKVLLSRTMAPAVASTKLSGSIIGTDGSWNDEGNTKEKAFDGNVATFFDGPSESGWAGMDLVTPQVITQLRYAPRPAGFAKRMVGGKFQGSNSADFSAGVVDLFTVSAEPPEGQWTMQPITQLTAFRYVRYLSPPNGYTDVAEIEFTGHPVAAPAPIVAGETTDIPLEDIAVITLREKPRPAETVAQAAPGEQEQSGIGGFMSFLFGGGNAHRPTRRGQAVEATAKAAQPPATRPSGPSGSWQVRLQGEDRWTGTVKSWSAKQVQFQPDASPEIVMDVPVERLRELWKGTPAQVAQARAMKIQSGTEDVAFIEKDGQVHNVKGLVVGLEGDSLVFRFNEADRKINLGRLVGILFASPQVVKEDTFHQAVELMSGDVISGQWKAVANGKVELETAWGKPMNIPLEGIANIQCRHGKLVYLSDLTPGQVEQVPYFDRLFPYRTDASLAGGMIRLQDGVFEKGISMHSRCVLQYDIGGKFEQFKAHVGFEQPEGLGGQCVIRLVGDGRVLYENAEARGDRPPVDVNVDVKGVGRLTLEVDFGQGQDVGDRVAWASARLLRANVQR